MWTLPNNNNVMATIPTVGTWVDYSALSTIVGWSSFTTKSIWILNVDNKFLLVNYFIDGVSNSSPTSFTIPNNAIERIDNNGIRCGSNGIFAVNPGASYILAGSKIINFILNSSGAGFTASGNKTIIGKEIIKIA